MVSGALELIWSDVRDESQSYIYVQHDHRIHIVYSHFRTHHESSIDTIIILYVHIQNKAKSCKKSDRAKKAQKAKERIHPTLQVPGWSPSSVLVQLKLS